MFLFSTTVTPRLLFRDRWNKTKNNEKMEFFMAISLFKRRKYEECATMCTNLLRKRPLDQVFILKLTKRLLLVTIN